MQISSLGEFALIRRLTSDFPLRQPSTVCGVGDDCAILSPNSADGQTLVTTDLLLEGIHFDLTYCPLRHLGYKVCVAGFSDIYAMMGTPRQLMVSVGVSKRFTVEDLEELYAGIRMACDIYGVDLVGGDTSASMTGLTLSVTCIGVAQHPVRRSGAQPNDLVCVSGDLGAAYMGLQLLEREKAVYLQQYEDWRREHPDLASGRDAGSVDPASQPPVFEPRFEGREYLLERQLKPEARRDIIKAILDAGLTPTSMIDVTDGLASEMLHLCHDSHVGCRIYEERLPIDYQTAVQAEEFNLNVSTVALNGGDDYELVFTVPLTQHELIQQIPGVRLIGHITEERLGAALITRDGCSEITLRAQGWPAPEV